MNQNYNHSNFKKNFQKGNLKIVVILRFLIYVKIILSFNKKC